MPGVALIAASGLVIFGIAILSPVAWVASTRAGNNVGQFHNYRSKRNEGSVWVDEGIVHVCSRAWHCIGRQHFEKFPSEIQIWKSASRYLALDPSIL